MSTESVPLNDARPRRRVWPFILLAALVAIGLVWWFNRPPATTAPAGRGGAEARPVTVVLATAARHDVPVYLEGLGTVTANKTVTVRSRVEGQLQSVAFKEGQPVKQGTVLAQIDPRSFQIALHTAQAALARDSAQLKGARLNLERFTQVRKEKLIAQQQVDDQQTMVDQLSAQVRADEAQVENARLVISQIAFQSWDSNRWAITALIFRQSSSIASRRYLNRR